jgi:hypothetical protein
MDEDKTMSEIEEVENSGLREGGEQTHSGSNDADEVCLGNVNRRTPIPHCDVSKQDSDLWCTSPSHHHFGTTAKSAGCKKKLILIY